MSKKKLFKICRHCTEKFENYWSKGICRPCFQEGSERVCISCLKNYTNTKTLWSSYCSKSCSGKVNAAKGVKAFQEKYGVANPSQLDWVKEKKIETTLKNYGVTNPSKDPAILDKAQNTLRSNHGGMLPFQTDEAKQTFRERWKVDHPMHSEELKERLKETILKKYGVENVFQNEEIIEKFRQEMFEKTGYHNPGQNPEIQAKMRETALKNLKNRRFVSKQEERIISHLGLAQGLCPEIKSRQVDGLDLKLKIAVEVDGWFWHKDKIERDTELTKTLLDADYLVLRVRMHSPNGELALLPLEDPNFHQWSISQTKVLEDNEEFLTMIKEMNSDLAAKCDRQIEIKDGEIIGGVT